MDASLLEEELDRCQKRGQLPKAVVPTDLYGQCCNYKQIQAICATYGVPVVVDAAEAMGAGFKRTEGFDVGSVKAESGYVHAGVGAKAAVFSFNGNKIITTSGGGMVASDDEALIKQARFLSQQARDDAPHYEHSQIGYNYRMSNIVAAIGRGQLRVLAERVDRKRAIFEYYRKALGDLPGIEFMPEAAYGRCNRWLTVLLITPGEFGLDREAVRLALEAENIESRPVWKPMHLQPVFHITELGIESSGYPTYDGKGRFMARVTGGAVSEDLFKRGLCLPSGTQMTEENLERVVRILRSLYKGH
jgi:dTDP-4-amino-4,6-dideoxygalactose transaminase